MVAWLLLPPPIEAQAPVFRLAVDSVRVDVAVHRDGQPVLGLQASDFEILDSGVRQDVSLVAADEAPLQVVLALDVSGSVQGRTLEQLRAAGIRLVDSLRAGDAAALVTFTGLVSIRSPMTDDAATVRRAFAFEPAAGSTALIDATHTAISLSQDGAGRPLVIVFSDGADTASFLTADAVLDTARRSSAVVYAVTRPQLAQRAFLDEITRRTGGELVAIAVPDQLASAFGGLLEAFRHRYLLSYVPKGVASDGWHDLVVRVKNRRVDVRARPGYWAGP
jgi:VWFA-related protein